MEALAIVGFVVMGIFCGAFGGRTGMVMLWKRGVPIVATGDAPMPAKEEASMIGVIYGAIAGGLIGGLSAGCCVPGVDIVRGIVGLLLSLFFVPLAYLLLLHAARLLRFVLRVFARTVSRASDFLVSLVPGDPKQQ